MAHGLSSIGFVHCIFPFAVCGVWQYMGVFPWGHGICLGLCQTILRVTASENKGETDHLHSLTCLRHIPPALTVYDTLSGATSTTLPGSQILRQGQFL